MASSKFLELQDFSDEDLVAELDVTKNQYRKLKFDHAITGLENPLELRVMRRDIARLNTEIRRRQLANNPEAAANRTKIRARRRRNG